MSLIHEALKKAEQQRQLGSVPTLGSPVMLTRRRRAWLGPVLSLLAAAILFAGAWWWWGRMPASPPPNGSTPVATTPASDAAKSPAVAKPAPTVAPVRARPAAPTRTVPGKPAAKPAAVKPAVTTLVVTKPAQSGALAPVKPVVQPTVPPPKTAPDTAPAAPAGKLAPPGPSQPASAKKDALPMYWELPYAQRKQMPEFKISMHVYSDNPAERFVILNGVRQVEGDDLSGGIKLEAIDADGIVLQLNGKRFRVPRDGGY